MWLRLFVLRVLCSVAFTEARAARSSIVFANALFPSVRDSYTPYVPAQFGFFRSVILGGGGGKLNYLFQRHVVPLLISGVTSQAYPNLVSDANPFCGLRIDEKADVSHVWSQPAT